MDANEQRARHIEVLREMRELGTPPCIFAHAQEELAALDAAIAALAQQVPADGEAVAWSVVGIGNRGEAYDGPKDCRAYTYQHHPGNLDASRLGSATHDAMNMSAGDSIDRGLCLLKALQAHGFGVFQLSAATQQAPHPVVDASQPQQGAVAWYVQDEESTEVVFSAATARERATLLNCGECKIYPLYIHPPTTGQQAVDDGIARAFYMVSPRDLTAAEFCAKVRALADAALAAHGKGG